MIKKKAQESQAITLMIKVIECGYDCYVQEIPEDGQDYDENAVTTNEDSNLDGTATWRDNTG